MLLQVYLEEAPPRLVVGEPAFNIRNSVLRVSIASPNLSLGSLVLGSSVKTINGTQLIRYVRY
jgi:hypothetical protein